MSTDESQPEPGAALWHLAERAHSDAALRVGSYDRSTRGASLGDVGFVHASRPEQLPGVARAIYAHVEEELVVLEIDPAGLADQGVEVRVEPSDPADPGSERFPHLYGPVPTSAVRRTRAAKIDKGWLELGPWEDTAMERQR